MMSMKFLRPLLTGLVFACAAAQLAAKSNAVDDGYYTAKDKEFYLTADEIFFIRPGLELEILNVTIPADMQPEVTFKLSDPGGLALDRNGVTTPGPVSTSFILAFIPQGETSYVAYTTRVQTSPITNVSATQSSTDSGGTYTDLGGGKYMYKFGTVLPMEYQADATHTLGVYARRDLREFELDRYVANELEHFVPSGVGTPKPRSIVTTETCNGRCHDPLQMHGGSRREVGLCILCHNATQTLDPDTGNLVDFPMMIHKIHAGAHLANGYTIIGYRQSVHDYSHVEFPAEINDCEICHTGGTPTAAFPLVANPNPVPVCDFSGRGMTELSWNFPERYEVRLNAKDGPLVARTIGEGSRETGKWVRDGMEVFVVDPATDDTVQKLYLNNSVLGCGDNEPGTFRGKPGVDHTNWLDNPSRRTCGACHDYVNFDTGEGHTDDGFAVDDDSICKFCHVPFKGNEFDRSIRGAHKVLYKSAQFPGVLVDIKSVTNTNPGDNPTVTFSLGSKEGPLNPGELDRLRLSIAGPNEDFSFYAQETVGNAAVKVGKNWAYTFATPLPLDAAGSFTAGFEGRNEIAIDFRDEVSLEEDQVQDGTFAFAVTDAVAMPRREVVADYKCEGCHSNLSLHGDNRNNTNYCVTCHRPDLTDVARRLPDTGEPEAVHFKYLIHKIHRGADLENGYVVYGYRSSVHDFSHVEFPGDLRNCEKCHVNDSYHLPLPEGLLATTAPRELWDPMMPVASACLSCHDGDDAKNHALAQTTFFGESCGACHGDGMSFAVEKLHAR